MRIFDLVIIVLVEIRIACLNLHDASTTLSLEASLRLKDHWRLAIEARAFANIPEDDFPLNGMRNDHSLMLGLEYHF